jgi:ribosomal protein L22
VAKAADKQEPEAPNKAAQQRRESATPPLVRAKARYVRVAPRKARLVADQIRGLPVDEARTLLTFSSRGAARDLLRLLDSAAANAEANHELVAEDLRVQAISVDEGPTLKRWRARARGRATRIEKKTSHISVALTPTTD